MKSEETTKRRKRDIIAEHPVLRFAAVGVISTVSDIIVLNLSGLVLNIYIATTLGFLVGLTVGFMLNAKFVFNADRTIHRYGKYGVTSVVGLGITLTTMYVLHDVSDWRVLPSKIVAVVIVFFWNYNLSRLWAFR